MWLEDTAWPAHPGPEAQALLESAAGLSGAAAATAAKSAAEFAYQRDLYFIALEAAELWLEHEPDDLEALALASALSVAANQADRAIATARSGLLPDAEAERVERFMQHFVEKLSGINAELLIAAPLGPVTAALAREFPDSTSVLALAASVALEEGRYEQVLLYADTLLKRDPANDAVHGIAATAMLRAGDPDSALARLTEQMAMRDSVFLARTYAMLLLENRQPREAISWMRNLREQHRELPQLALAEARMLRQLGAGSLAEPILLEVFARNQAADQARRELGRNAADRGDWLEAAEWYSGIRSEALALTAAQGLVQALVALDNHEEALAALLELVRLYPRHTYESLPLAADVMRSAGRLADAMAAYDEGLRYVPESRRLRMARANLLVELKQHRRAIRAMEDLLADHPRDSQVLNALGYTLADRGIRLQEAREHLSLALELAPDSPAIIDSMGWVLYRLGRPEQAVPLLEQALAALPHPEVAAHLAEVLFELGETRRATELLRESLQRFEDTALLEIVRDKYSR